MPASCDRLPLDYTLGRMRRGADGGAIAKATTLRHPAPTLQPSRVCVTVYCLRVLY